MSQTRDNSMTTRTNLLKSRTFAVYNRLNPTVNMLAQRSYGAESEQLFLDVGKSVECCVVPTSTCIPPTGGVSFNISDRYTPPSPYDLSYNSAYDITWYPVTNATSYTVSLTYKGTDDSILVLTTGPTSITAYINFDEYDYETPADISVTALNTCGSTSGSTTLAAPCFLAGSLVSMADGSTKPIEDVVIGDEIVGAFGEINRVLALHRPFLGANTMTRINETHSTSSHHPHISVDKKFYAAAPSVVEKNTYGREHIVIDAEGNSVSMMLHGLKKGRVQTLREGIVLKTIDGGRIVETLETYTLPADTQLYNLVVGGSHTYHVDGYAVTGWPREDDFDYDTWQPKIL